jgi:hypothetical protein
VPIRHRDPTLAPATAFQDANRARSVDGVSDADRASRCHSGIPRPARSRPLPPATVVGAEEHLVRITHRASTRDRLPVDKHAVFEPCDTQPGEENLPVALGQDHLVHAMNDERAAFVSRRAAGGGYRQVVTVRRAAVQGVPQPVDGLAAFTERGPAAILIPADPTPPLPLVGIGDDLAQVDAIGGCCRLCGR